MSVTPSLRRIKQRLAALEAAGPGGTAPGDASPTAKGLIRLAGMLAGTADAPTVGLKGTTAQLAATDPTTVPAGMPFLVTNDPTWGTVQYFALGSPQAWVDPLASLRATVSARDIASAEITGNYDVASVTIPVNVGAPLSFNAPGADYRLHVFCPSMASDTLDLRIVGGLYDETSTQVGQWQAWARSATITRGTSVSFTSKKISGVPAGTAKTYQVNVLRSSENASGTARIASTTSSPIVVRASLA